MNFDAHFEAALGFPPLPWQRALFKRLFELRMPDAVDLPTGLGKTAVMAIWLIARAAQPKLPRRLVYVVDRRAVVDQATSVAESLRDFVSCDKALEDALGLKRPLPISTLRGQFVDNREWLEDPSSPAIVVGTVDMIGSRLLFGGYGVTRKMRPYHAGLLGRDTLVVLDEAHLVPPFEGLLRAIQDTSSFDATDATLRQVLPRFHMMSLSATGLDGAVSVHSLDDEDLAHDVVKTRLNAAKALRLIKLADGEGQPALERALIEHARDIVAQANRARRVVIYVNSRDVAQKVAQGLERMARDEKVPIQTELFVGARRVFERTLAQQRLHELGFFPSLSPSPATSPTYLVATSAGEVGVDLDADDMVCDLVAWERMVQRLGRVNRRGQDAARVVVVVDPKPARKVAEEEALGKLGASESLLAKDRKKYLRIKAKVDARERAWEARQGPFNCLPPLSEGERDGSPGALRTLKIQSHNDEALRLVLAEATTPEPLRPALTRPLVDAWSMTSLDEHTGRPALAPWLRGWLPSEPPETSITWRKHLPTRDDINDLAPGAVEHFFEAAPVHTSETLDAETARVVEWLKVRGKALQKQAGDGAWPQPDSVIGFILDSEGRSRGVLRMADLLALNSANKQDADEKKKELSGDRGTLLSARLIMDARVGGLSRGLLDAQEDAPPRTADDGEVWLAEGVVGFRIRLVGDHGEESHVTDPRWRSRHTHVLQATAEGESVRSVVIEKWWANSATEEDRSTGKPQRLDDHQMCAERYARMLGGQLGLDDEYLTMLALAACLHDEGKGAARWQRAFRADSAAASAEIEGPLAKTDRSIDFALLDGYRHELGSVLIASEDARLLGLRADIRELALHLIAAHHGFARPIISARSCDGAPPSTLQMRVREIAARFATLQAQWGPWGLAWWEALLRAADQLASRENARADIEVTS